MSLLCDVTILHRWRMCILDLVFETVGLCLYSCMNMCVCVSQFLRMQTDVVLNPTSSAKRLHDLKVSFVRLLLYVVAGVSRSGKQGGVRVWEM